MSLLPRNHLHWVPATVLACIALSACGGGGSDDTTPSPVATSASAPLGAAAPTAPTAPTVRATDGPAPVEVPLSEPAPVTEPERAPAPVPVPGPAPGLLTAFDGTESLQGTPDGQSERLLGVQPTPLLSGPVPVSAPDIDPGGMTIQYQGGTDAERWARIIEEPGVPGNRVLAFKLMSANVPNAAGIADKGRVQLNAYDVNQIRAKEVRFKTRVFLTPDFALLRQMPAALSWLTISEWWNNPTWTGQDHPFRITVNVVKPSSAPGSALNFSVKAQTADPSTLEWHAALWTEVNSAIQVPVGQWVTLEYAFLEGDASTGRFYLAMTPDGGVRQVIFDVRNFTHHPQDPAPDGITHINPAKLYTAKSTIDFVTQRGGALQVFWDDMSFRLCRERSDENTSACAPLSFD